MGVAAYGTAGSRVQVGRLPAADCVTGPCEAYTLLDGVCLFGGPLLVGRKGRVIGKIPDVSVSRSRTVTSDSAIVLKTAQY